MADTKTRAIARIVGGGVVAITLLAGLRAAVLWALSQGAPAV